MGESWLGKFSFWQSVSVLLGVLLFLVPTNWFISCCRELAFANNLLIDYLLPQLHASELVGLIILLLLVWKAIDEAILNHSKGLTIDISSENWLKSLTKSSSHWLIILGFWMVLGLTQLTTAYALIGLITWLKLSFLGALSYLLLKHRHQLKKLPILIGATTTIVFQSSLAWFQYTQQSSLVGYWLLGEPNLAVTTGLASIIQQGRKLILPYGTTAHPNVLAGIVAVYTILLLELSTSRFSKWHRLLVVIIGAGTIVITQSISAFLLLIFYACTTFIKKSRVTLSVSHLLGASITILIIPIVVAFVLPRLEYESIDRRLELNQIGLSIFLTQPIFGIGLQQSVSQIEQFDPDQSLIRFIQPPHHVGVLWLAETGLVGLLFLGYLVLTINKQISPPNKLKVAISLLVITPLLAWDHYLLTLPSGRWLLALAPIVLLTLSSKKAD